MYGFSWLELPWCKPHLIWLYKYRVYSKYGQIILNSPIFALHLDNSLIGYNILIMFSYLHSLNHDMATFINKQFSHHPMAIKRKFIHPFNRHWRQKKINVGERQKNYLTIYHKSASLSVNANESVASTSIIIIH